MPSPSAPDDSCAPSFHAECLETARAARNAGNLPECILQATAASTSEDAEIRYHSFACVGRAHLHRAEHEQARGWFRLAKEVADELLPHWRAPAAHDLFLCWRETDLVEARTCAGEAFLAYGERGGRLGALLADFAVLNQPADRWWPYFEPYAVSNALYDPQCARVNMMESAAAMHARLQVAMLWERVHNEADEALSGTALRLVTAGGALARSGLWTEAGEALQRARRLAQARGEDAVRERAEDLMDYVQREKPPRF